MAVGCHELNDPGFVRDVLQWDVAGWRFALDVWREVVADPAGAEVLDIGARDGGLSLYFAAKGCRVVCSDYRGPSERARELHRRYGVQDRVYYRAVDAVAIDFPDGSFDIVCFKSVLGSVAGGDGLGRQQQAVAEMYRVLRPGGRLLFAENLRASRLHQMFRRCFVAWGQRWRYVALAELEEMLSCFARRRVVTSGFLGTLGRSEGQRRLLHVVDVLLNPVVPSAWHYVAAGWALK